MKLKRAFKIILIAIIVAPIAFYFLVIALPSSEIPLPPKEAVREKAVSAIFAQAVKEDPNPLVNQLNLKQVQAIVHEWYRTTLSTTYNDGLWMFENLETLDKKAQLKAFKYWVIADLSEEQLFEEVKRNYSGSS